MGLPDGTMRQRLPLAQGVSNEGADTPKAGGGLGLVGMGLPDGTMRQRCPSLNGLRPAVGGGRKRDALPLRVRYRSSCWQ